jgi:RNA polymerase sigma factor (sigma-70 family)
LGATNRPMPTLVKRHQRFVFTLALRFAKGREDAEEIAQDCFIKAYRSLSSFQQQSKFSTWLYSIVYTTAMTFLRKKRIDTSSIDDDESYIQIENKPSGYDEYNVENKIALILYKPGYSAAIAR